MGDEFNYEFQEAQAEYSSGSQLARVWTEDWVLREMYCPACGSPRLEDFANNTPVADFFCGLCDEQFELKAKNGPIGKTVPDGAYETMMSRLQSDTRPSLMVLRYDKSAMSVRDLAVVPKQFFIPDLIHKRKPLSAKAKRAGWVGCDIRIERIPDIGKISLIDNRIAQPIDAVVALWEKTAFLRRKSVSQMGWVADVLRCVDRIGQSEFTLVDMYKFENYLSELHPENNNVKPKIRQQLQVLRDAGIIEFVARGEYKLI